MKLQGVLIKLVALLCLGSTAAFAAPEKTSVASTTAHATMTTFGRFDAVRLFQPHSVVKGVAILASGDGRWDDPLMQRMAQLLVDAGNIVIGIDTVAYLQNLQDTSQQCAYTGGDFEDLAHAMEKQLKVQRYLPPVLVGYSSGAALVYAVLAQAPRGTFQAGMSVGFCAELNLQTALCSGRESLSKPINNDDGAASALLPLQRLSASWVVLQGEQDQICRVDTARRFSSQVMAAQLRALPNVDHFFAGTRDWRDAFLNAYQGLAYQGPTSQSPASRSPAAQSQQAQVAAGGLLPEVSDLPITEVPSLRAGEELAILLTGDGGWAELDQELAHDLSTSGVSVVALSSLQYFWQARTPQQTAKDVSRLIAHYTHVWQRPRVRLLGYSFGADVLPAVINALPAADRARITSVGLLSLLPRTSFEIHVAGWLGQVVGEQAVRPELEKLATAGIAVTCVYGRDDDDSLCRELPAELAHVVALPGAHNCNDDHAAIVRAWLTNRNAVSLRAIGSSDRQPGNNVPPVKPTHL